MVKRSQLVRMIAVLALVGGAWVAGGAAQNPLLSDARLKALGASAKTAVEHRSLAAHYRAHAAEHENDAKTHDFIVSEARKRAGDDDAWDLARDAAHYADHSREAAEALNDLAVLHEEMAKRAK